MMKRGFEPSIAVALQVLEMTGDDPFFFNFLFGKALRKSSLAVVVRKNVDRREVCAVAAAVEYRQAAEFMQWSLSEG